MNFMNLKAILLRWVTLLQLPEEAGEGARVQGAVTIPRALETCSLGENGAASQYLSGKCCRNSSIVNNIIEKTHLETHLKYVCMYLFLHCFPIKVAHHSWDK